MNQALADAAIKAITDSRFEDETSFCQRFVKQVIASVYGDKYAAYALGDAQESGLAWKAAGLTITPREANPLQPGDILYKTGWNPGHVGIYVGDKGVAENSSTRIGRVQGAKGYRTLDQFGQFDLVVRLPALPSPGWTIQTADGKQLAQGLPSGDTGTGLVRAVTEFLGGSVGVDSDRKIITINKPAKG